MWPRNFVVSDGVLDTIHNFPVQEEFRNTIKMSGRQTLLASEEIPEFLKKGAIQKAETAQEQFLSSHFFVRKKDGGNCPVINLKKTKYIHPLRANKRFVLSEISSRTKRFPIQDRYQRRLLRSSSQQTIIDMGEIQMVRQPIWVSLPLFWFRASSKCFYQITKKPNCSSEFWDE